MEITLEPINDSISAQVGIADFCGPRSYRIGDYPSFLTLTDEVITVDASDPSSVGSYSVDLTAFLHDLPSLEQSSSLSITI
jgi:hypothetical protein